MARFPQLGSIRRVPLARRLLPPLGKTEAPPPEKPAVVTTAASGIGHTTATLNGTVNPKGQASEYWFQWGTTVGYGNETGKTSAGSGSQAVAAPKALSGLTAGVTYHFRIRASNATGTSDGADETFEAVPEEAEPTEAIHAIPHGRLVDGATTLYRV